VPATVGYPLNVHWVAQVAAETEMTSPRLVPPPGVAKKTEAEPPGGVAATGLDSSTDDSEWEQSIAPVEASSL
jgi:hypothetical protein